MTPPRRPVRAPRRAFSLLEVMLAAVLGSVVLVTAFGLFTVVNRQGREGSLRFQEALESQRARETIVRAMQSLVLAEPPPTTPRAAGQTTPATPPTEANARPRFLLEEDTRIGRRILATRPNQTAEGAARVTYARPQRLEVALQAPPIFVPDQDEILRVAQTRRRDEARLRRADDADKPIGLTPGVRGVFELSFEPDRTAPGQTFASEADEGTWTLWWRPIWPAVGPSDRELLRAASAGLMTEAEINAAGRVPLMNRLVVCRWEVYINGERRAEHTALTADDLPAYLTLEVMTREGAWHSWMFEVTWGHGLEPGEPIYPPSAPAAPPEGGNGNEARDAEGAQTTPAPGTQPRPATGGGRQPADRGRR